MKSEPRLIRPTKALSKALGLVVCIATAGCSVGPDFLRPDNPPLIEKLAPRTDYTDGYATDESALPWQRWELFNDEVLTTLIRKAAVSNLNLQIAANRIEQSRAQLGITAGELLPTIAIAGSEAREGLSKHGKFAALGAPTSPSYFYQIGFEASWELDLWGRARRMQEGAAAALAASKFDLVAAGIALKAEVARTYLQLRGTQAQLNIAIQNVQIAEHVLRLVESRERNGVATRLELASARAQLASVSSVVPELTQRRNTLMNGLALLLGEKPRSLDEQLRQTLPLPSLPTAVPVGIPSELARRRPDILRAEAQLHAATAAIGVAKADFYPRIGLKGRAGVEAFDSGDISSWDSRYFSVGPTIYLPIFQGGQIEKRLELSEARQKNAALAYRQTVLHAWHEVDNALDAWTAHHSQHSELQASYDQNKLALQVAERGFQEGVSDYLNVLTAQRNLLASQTNLNNSATSATLTLVNLYKALGGGWSTAEVEGLK